MYDILKITRTDIGSETSWNNDISMIISSDSSEFTENLIKDVLFKDYSGNVMMMQNGKPLTRDFIQIEKLGTSSDIKPGLLLTFNVGA